MAQLVAKCLQIILRMEHKKMAVDLDFSVTENSSVVIQATFTDEEGDTISAGLIKSIKWTLKDVQTGRVVNNRKDVSVTPANPVNIFLYDDDLKIINRRNETEQRELIVKVIYDSVYQENATLRESCLFKVRRLSSG